MCTLLFRYRPEDEYPLAILSNRDEAYKRPSGGWDWRGESGQYFAPVDLEAGGTWIGLNRHGVVVALTNIFPGRRDPAFRSRGKLVTDMLALPHASDAPGAIETSFETYPYNHFNLLVADAGDAFLFTWVKGQLDCFGLLPGIYQVGNRPYSGTDLANSDGTSAEWLEQNAVRLTNHPKICRHGPGYGTRCSHKLLVHGADPLLSLVWHLEGHPCQGTYQLVLGEDHEHSR
jgi:uncharacterized protein with NRDE domain